MKKIAFKKVLLNENEVSLIKHYLEEILNVPMVHLQFKKLVKTCFNELCIVYEDGEDLDTVIYQGRWIAGIIGDDLFLSPWLYSSIYNTSGFKACIVVNKKALEIFLYGGDIFASSITRFYEPIDNVVAVIDPRDNAVVGAAKPIVKGEILRKIINDKREEPVFKNLFDLGVFLREFG